MIYSFVTQFPKGTTEHTPSPCDIFPLFKSVRTVILWSTLMTGGRRKSQSTQTYATHGGAPEPDWDFLGPPGKVSSNCAAIDERLAYTSLQLSLPCLLNTPH